MSFGYLCEVRTTDCPLLCMLVMASQRRRRATGSTPVDGSSRKIIG